MQQPMNISLFAAHVPHSKSSLFMSGHFCKLLLVLLPAMPFQSCWHQSRQTAYSSQQGIPGEPDIRLVVPKRTRCGCDVKKGGATTICSTKKVVAKVTRLNLLRKPRRRKAKSLVLVSDAYGANQSLVKKRWRAKSNACLVGRSDCGASHAHLPSSMSHA